MVIKYLCKWFGVDWVEGEKDVACLDLACNALVRGLVFAVSVMKWLKERCMLYRAVSCISYARVLVKEI